MIQHKTGDLFDSGADVIVHQVNCQGVMGSGVAKQVKALYPDVFATYFDLCSEHRNCRDHLLGKVLFMNGGMGKGADGPWVANLFAQEKYGRDKQHTDYKALKECFLALYEDCMYLKTHHRLPEIRNGIRSLKIGIPYKMSCDRGGGDWDGVVFPMIQEILGKFDVVICELPKKLNV